MTVIVLQVLVLNSKTFDLMVALDEKFRKQKVITLDSTEDMNVCAMFQGNPYCQDTVLQISTSSINHLIDHRSTRGKVRSTSKSLGYDIWDL